MKFFNHYRCNIPEKFKHNIENIDIDTFHNKYENVILSCYFTGKKDPIHHFELKNEKQETDNYNYIKPLYESSKKHNLHLIIFHDNLSSKFIEQYTTNKIIFRKTKLISNLFFNDERFIIYYEYLAKHNYKNILSSDISDVHINKNPFDLIDNYWKRNEKLDYNLDYTSTYFTKKEKLFIQNQMSSHPIINNKKIFIGLNSINNKSFETIQPWFQHRIDKLNKLNEALQSTKYPQFTPNNFQIYNPGTIMGNYQNYMCFLRNFLEILFIVARKSEKNNWNMMIASYLVTEFLYDEINHNTACSKYVYTGYPFCSLYKRYEIPEKSPNCLIHK